MSNAEAVAVRVRPVYPTKKVWRKFPEKTEDEKARLSHAGASAAQAAVVNYEELMQRLLAAAQEVENAVLALLQPTFNKMYPKGLTQWMGGRLELPKYKTGCNQDYFLLWPGTIMKIMNPDSDYLVIPRLCVTDLDMRGMGSQAILSSVIEHGKQNAFHFEVLRKLAEDGPRLIEFCTNYEQNIKGHTWVEIV